MVDADRWTAVVALADPSRRGLYEYVRHADHAVGRDEAGRATGLSRGLAAFHLDKLVDAGLLRVAPSTRSPGPGRTPKMYEPAVAGLAVTIPERRYDLVAEILADAVATDPADARRAALRLARRRGRRIGARLPEENADLAGALERLGYEPRVEAGGHLRLRNCPFRALAVRQTDLICEINHELVAGILDGLGGAWEATARPSGPGACCVEVRRSGAR